MVDSDFSSLFDLLPIGAYRSSPDGRQLRANAALVKLNGYSSESEMLSAVENIATEWYCDPSRRDEFIAMLYSQTRVVDFVSEVYRHKTRERIWVREHAHLVSGVDGQPLYFEGTVQDITLEHLNYLNLQASGSLTHSSDLYGWMSVNAAKVSASDTTSSEKRGRILVTLT